MNITRRKMLGLTGKIVVLSSISTGASFATRVDGTRMASDPVTTDVGEKILREGGNAIDAAVAAAFASGIPLVSKCGIGGYGGAMVISLANGKTTAIDFNMKAPAAAHADMFRLTKDDKVVNGVNAHGWLAAGVPGTLAGLELATKRYGTKSLRELLQPAITLAKTTTKKDRYVKFSALAETLSTLANRNSGDSFYRGDLAQEITAAFKQGGGLVTAKDLASYEAREVEPYTLEWNGNTLHAAPLGASGLMVLQMVSVLKALQWDKTEDTAAATHARLEAMRVVWKDRFDTYGDPDFAQVPIQKYLSPEYAEAQAGLIRDAVKKQRPVPLQIERVETVGTLHISAADAAGNLVSLTLTQGNGWGAKVVVESLGVLLGNGMARFDPRPGKPNSIAPGKRPVHNMCPIIMTSSTRRVAIGAAGGTKIPNSLFDFFCHYLGRKKTLIQAVDEPRMNCFGTLDVAVERDWSQSRAKYLEQIGYKVKTLPGAYLSAVELNAKTGETTARSHVGNPFQEHLQPEQ